MNATDLFRSPRLDEMQRLSIELGTAVGDQQEWERMDGATFVCATRNDGRMVVIGRPSGWVSIRHPEGGNGDTSDPYESATTAIEAAFGKTS